ncbi:DUF4491 family protein [Treponema primitia]|uniref:DUF4491 family protein n=1 Tax=Treponema primitia TaxID=88058 RepID=UPI0002555868|nr:DUF4491 family protein [Treponema primitia]
MSFHGLIIGAAAFILIGLFHPIIIHAEYHFGVKAWPAFLLFGIVFSVISLLIKNSILSSIIGIIAFCSFWSIKELFEQHKRVARGWFPKKPTGV